MEGNVFFSIIVPVYKIPYDLLAISIESVINQDFQNYEILLIDDGSPDRCGEICDQYAKQCNKIRVIHQKNAGLSVVRNVGFEQAKGTWVCFVDGDDYMESNALSVGARLLDNIPDDTDVLICDAFVDYETYEKPNHFLGRETKGIVSFKGEEKKEILNQFFPLYYKHQERDVLCDIGSTWARFYRKSFIQENHLRNVPGLRRTQDNIFNLYVVEKARRICYCCERIYHYRMRDDSACNKYDPYITDAFKHLYTEYLKFADYKGAQEYYQRAYSKLMSLFTRVMANCFVHKKNPDKLRTKITKMKEYFEDPLFLMAIRNFDYHEQKPSSQIMHFLLSHRYYFFLYIISALHEKVVHKK
jgi:glycosyltransferase involved in cell wall biosynthesis